MRKRAIVLIVCGWVGAGCQAGRVIKASSPAVGSAVGSAAGAIIGYQHGEAGIGRSIGSSLGSAAGQVAGAAAEPRQAPRELPADAASGTGKFCPVGGERYPDSVRYCPNHGTELHHVEPASMNQ